MEKGSAIAILILLIGVAGFGYLYYDSKQPTPPSPIESLYILEKITPQPGIVRTWSDTTSLMRLLGSITPYNIDPDIAINFTVNSGESVYFSFVCLGYIVPNSATNGYLGFRFCIDGIEDYPSCYAGANSSSGPVYISISLQNVTSLLAPGSHNITIYYIWEYLDSASSWIASRSLVVQTLIP